MAGNTFASVGQRTASIAMPSTKSTYKPPSRQPYVDTAPGMGKGGVSKMPRQRLFGRVSRGALGVVNAGVFAGGGTGMQKFK